MEGKGETEKDEGVGIVKNQREWKSQDQEKSKTVRKIYKNEELKKLNNNQKLRPRKFLRRETDGEKKREVEDELKLGKIQESQTPDLGKIQEKSKIEIQKILDGDRQID